MGDTIKPAIMNLPDKPDSSSSSGTDNGNIASRLDDRCKEMSAAPPLQSPPPPASWPSSSSPLLPRRSYQHATATPSAMASSHAMSEGFNEEMEVLVPAREAKFFVRVAGRELAAANGVAVVLHGGGFTGMSWAPAAGLMKRDCCVLAPDLRGHGRTLSPCSPSSSATGDDEGALMSLEDLAEDVTSLLAEIFANGLLARRQRPVSKETDNASSSDTQTTTVRCDGPTPNEKDDAEEAADTGHDTEAPSSRRSPRAQGDDARGGCSANGGERPEGKTRCRTGDGELGNRSGDAMGGEAVAGGRTRGEDSGGSDESGDGSRSSSAGGVDADERIGGGLGTGAALPRIKVLLVGHSLGGSIAVRMAGAAEEFMSRCRETAEIAGVVAVDVVEGTALAALDDMPQILRKIPKGFPSMEEAVQWHVKTRAVRNSAAASVVVPSRLRREGSGSTRVVWRTDLRATERHWRGWFEGMSAAFLALPIPKLLVVAGMDRLDTELTAAHMQGKFQLKLVYGCGHSVQEDQPNETATSIMTFAVRNSILRGRTNGGSDDGRCDEQEKLRQKLARARKQAGAR